MLNAVLLPSCLAPNCVVCGEPIDGQVNNRVEQALPYFVSVFAASAGDTGAGGKGASPLAAATAAASSPPGGKKAGTILVGPVRPAASAASRRDHDDCAGRVVVGRARARAAAAASPSPRAPATTGSSGGGPNPPADREAEGNGKKGRAKRVVEYLTSVWKVNKQFMHDGAASKASELVTLFFKAVMIVGVAKILSDAGALAMRDVCVKGCYDYYHLCGSPDDDNTLKWDAKLQHQEDRMAAGHRYKSTGVESVLKRPKVLLKFLKAKIWLRAVDVTTARAAPEDHTRLKTLFEDAARAAKSPRMAQRFLDMIPKVPELVGKYIGTCTPPPPSEPAAALPRGVSATVSTPGSVPHQLPRCCGLAVVSRRGRPPPRVGLLALGCLRLLSPSR